MEIPGCVVFMLFLKENDTLNSNRNKEHHFSFPWMTQEEKDDIKYLSFDE